jgi:hypothetical protein
LIGKIKPVSKPLLVFGCDRGFRITPGCLAYRVVYARMTVRIL